MNYTDKLLEEYDEIGYSGICQYSAGKPDEIDMGEIKFIEGSDFAHSKVRFDVPVGYVVPASWDCPAEVRDSYEHVDFTYDELWHDDDIYFEYMKIRAAELGLELDEDNFNEEVSVEFGSLDTLNIEAFKKAIVTCANENTEFYNYLCSIAANKLDEDSKEDYYHDADWVKDQQF